MSAEELRFATKSEAGVLSDEEWSSPRMLMLYAASTGTERALAEHRRLSPLDQR